MEGPRPQVEPIEQRPQPKLRIPVKHQRYYLGGPRTFDVSYFDREVENKFYNLAADELRALDRVALMSRDNEFGYSAEHVSIPDDYTPHLADAVHVQPEFYGSSSSQVTESRVVFSQGDNVFPYNEHTQEVVDTQIFDIPIHGVNAALFNIAIAR